MKVRGEGPGEGLQRLQRLGTVTPKTAFPMGPWLPPGEPSVEALP